MALKVLNAKERKNIRKMLDEQFGVSEKTDEVYLLNENKGRVYLLAREAAEFPYEELRVDSLGFYFGTIMPEGEIRLSIEGCQMIGPQATKGVIELTDEQAHFWVRGHSLELETGHEGHIIVAHKNPATGKMDFIGCGKVNRKEDSGKQFTLLLNYVPKTRYVRSDD